MSAKTQREYNKATKNLKFSHFVSNIRLNNVDIEAYYLDDENYLLVMVEKSATGKILSVSTREISIADYEDLDYDAYKNTVRFLAAEEYVRGENQEEPNCEQLKNIFGDYEA